MKSKYLFLLLLVIVLHGSILTKLIFYPYPELFIYPYLTAHGFLPYSQILDQHFPGLLFLPINFNNLGLVNEYVARAWLIGSVVINHLLIFICASRLLKDKKKGVLANLLYLVWQPFLEGYVLWIDSFMPIFLLSSFYFSLRFIDKKKLLDLILSSFFISLAVIFKQTAIPLGIFLGVYLYINNSTVKTLIYYCLAGIALPLVIVIYYFYLGVITDMWFWTVTFNLTTYAHFGTKGFPLRSLTKVIGVFSPLIFLPFLKERRVTIILGIFILGSLVGVFDRPDFVHFQPALPFVILAVALIISNLISKNIIKIFFLGYLLLTVGWLSIFYQGHISTVVLFFDPQTKLVSQKVMQYTKPNEEIFLFGLSPHLYQMSQTIPAGHIFVFQFPWFMMEAQDRVLLGVKSSLPNLILRDKSMKTEDSLLTDYASKINSYIDENYVVFDKIGSVEFLKRKELYAGRL